MVKKITFKDLMHWMRRFKNITNGPVTDVRDVRLANLMTDLETAYNIPFLHDDEYNKRNPIVIKLYEKISKARTL